MICKTGKNSPHAKVGTKNVIIKLPAEIDRRKFRITKEKKKEESGFLLGHRLDKALDKTLDKYLDDFFQFAARPRHA